MSVSAFKWVLFVFLSLSVPLLFFLGMAAGRFPLAGIAIISLLSITTDPLLSIFGLVHIFFFGALLYGASYLASKLVGRLGNVSRFLIASALAASLAMLTLQPSYGWGGYATSRYYPLHVIVHRAMHPRRA